MIRYLCCALLTMWSVKTFAQSPKRELRAVWIATVDNIDWPRPGDYNPASQQQHFRQILDTHQQTGLNAVFVQVRDAADSYYAKGQLEPWSEWLTGRQGKAPEPFYDPLTFMLEEAHRRGIEFHAWLNLNRAVFKGHTNVTPDHVSRLHPDWMITYDGTKIFNVGVPEVRNYITKIVTNLARNYDLDGIHFDDYFYPYRVPGQVLDDQVAFYKYGAGYRSINDWRRANIDQLIHQISDSLKAINPRIKFGISPSAVWRNRSPLVPDGSETRGLSAYEELYADTRKWIRESWIDYIAPQVYFHRTHRLVPYEPLIEWWRKNCYGRHLYIGQGAYRLNGRENGWETASEIADQIRWNRKHPEIQGSIFFSSRSLTNNFKGVQDTLRNGLYQLPAFVPTMPWKDATAPLPPQEFSIEKDGNGIVLKWETPPPAVDGDRPYRYIVYRFQEQEAINLGNVRHIVGILNAPGTSFRDTPPTKGNYRYVVTSMDRLSNESLGVMSDVENQ